MEGSGESGGGGGLQSGREKEKQTAVAIVRMSALAQSDRRVCPSAQHCATIARIDPALVARSSPRPRGRSQSGGFFRPPGTVVRGCSGAAMDGDSPMTIPDRQRRSDQNTLVGGAVGTSARASKTGRAERVR